MMVCRLLVALLLILMQVEFNCPCQEESSRVAALTEVMEKLRPLHKKLGKPRPGDWLAVHPEPGRRGGGT